MERFFSYHRFLTEYFGEKVYKICLNGGFSCPNRDGTLSYGGCIFCSEGGSGEYSERAALPISRQIVLGKKQTAKKYHGTKYIAYFQAFTNTYAPVETLRRLYEEAIAPEEIVALAIGTRPDCLSPEVLSLLEETNQKKPVFLEMGLQTFHDSTAAILNRGYPTSQFTEMVKECEKRNIRTTAHLILGLPGESKEMQYETIAYLNALPVHGVKLSMLYLLKQTELAKLYAKNPFPIYTMEEYIQVVTECILRLRKDIVIERMTGDGPKDLLIAPKWIANKRLVLNSIQKELKRRNIYQGTYQN